MLDHDAVVDAYHRDGVVRIRRFFQPEQIEAIRLELERYLRDDLASKPPDARTVEADGTTIRNLWRLEQHNSFFRELGHRRKIMDLVQRLVGDTPLLVGVETFNKPARVGSAVPDHQDNAYFCQVPPDMLTVWVAIDAVTETNGPVCFVRGSHRSGMLPTRPSGVSGNSIGLASPPEVPEEQELRATLDSGDATIHHCQTIHHSGPNRSDRARLGLLLVYRGEHTRTDPRLQAAYDMARSATPPA
jgi:ectoine hydroxylase-related dioxygenase (phytanoyl-CoA dioxygenase family)